MNLDNLKFKNARYLNSSRNLIYVEIEDPAGNTSKLTIKAPKDNQLGVDKYFDKVVEIFTLEKLSDDFKIVEREAAKNRLYQEQKTRSEKQRNKLNALLEKKAEAFESKLIEVLDNRSLRTAIRKAESQKNIDLLLAAALIHTIKDHNLDLDKTIDLINGIFETEEEEAQPTAE